MQKRFLRAANAVHTHVVITALAVLFWRKDTAGAHQPVRVTEMLNVSFLMSEAWWPGG